MNKTQLERIKSAKGFIAALDQSGGSTPKALQAYGVGSNAYNNDEEMFARVHEMRCRIIESPSFTSHHILGAILFEDTLDRTIDSQLSADYLWEKKEIVPFLKIDKGLAAERDGVQLMNPIPNLTDLLHKANERHIFGTKERSVIKFANPKGIKDVVEQQFELALTVFNAGLIPIIEPEVDIYSPEKEQAETLLLQEIETQLAALAPEINIMLKLTIPTVDNLYQPLLDNPHIIRIVALSGGYSQQDANEKLARNHGIIASFSRALTEGLTYQQTQTEFDKQLFQSIDKIYKASIQ